MTTTLTACPAPAKLNLFLHVTGRRPDGYHLLQSAFQLIDRCDTLDFALREDGQIRRTNEVPGVPEESDLVIRAAHLLRQASGQMQLGADITVHKVLPMGGGVGGGSSDAATTLLVLNHLWKCGYNRASLMEMGLKLGADVPFFLFGRNAFAEGVGEELSVLQTAECWYVVIEPGVSVPTSIIFSSKLLTRDTQPVRITDFPDATKQVASSFGKNDLEMVATAHFPEVAAAVEWLGKFGSARMTGSGACVFCAFEHEHQADEVLKQLPSRWIGWKAKAMQEHPLAHLVQS